jgi:DNA mismatch endonuclease (patch repair protein)
MRSRKDPLTPEARSRRMSLVRAKGNRSTEAKVEAVFVADDVIGWIKHPRDLSPQPDFYFAEARLALFVDGCFWHSCPKCNRKLPATRRAFWRKKLEATRRRDEAGRRRLRRAGVSVMRVWEHELRDERWLIRLRRMLARRVAGGLRGTV